MTKAEAEAALAADQEDRAAIQASIVEMRAAMVRDVEALLAERRAIDEQISAARERVDVEADRLLAEWGLRNAANVAAFSLAAASEAAAV